MKRRTARDAVADAHALMREAERGSEPATWAIASDAWSAIGEDKLAWYAFVRSKGYGGRTISHAKAEELRDWLRDFEAYPRDGAARSADVWAQANIVKGQLEVFEFMTTQPERWFAYAMEGDRVGNWLSAPMGRTIRRGKPSRPFGTGGRIERVRVRADNGFDYVGTCAVENGTYCKLRRSTPWLRW